MLRGGGERGNSTSLFAGSVTRKLGSEWSCPRRNIVWAPLRGALDPGPEGDHGHGAVRAATRGDERLAACPGASCCRQAGEDPQASVASRHPCGRASPGNAGVLDAGNDITKIHNFGELIRFTLTRRSRTVSPPERENDPGETTPVRRR